MPGLALTSEFASETLVVHSTATRYASTAQLRVAKRNRVATALTTSAPVRALVPNGVFKMAIERKAHDINSETSIRPLPRVPDLRSSVGVAVHRSFDPLRTGPFAKQTVQTGCTAFRGLVDEKEIPCKFQSSPAVLGDA